MQSKNKPAGELFYIKYGMGTRTELAISYILPCLFGGCFGRGHGAGNQTLESCAYGMSITEPLVGHLMFTFMDEFSGKNMFTYYTGYFHLYGLLISLIPHAQKQTWNP